MFATFLIGTVLASLAALALLLAAPRPQATGAPSQVHAVPWTTLTVVVLVAALAFVGGLMWGA